MNKWTFILILFTLASVCGMCAIAYVIINDKLKERKEKKSYDGIIDACNKSDIVNKIGSRIPLNKVDEIFNRAKNPWDMTPATFQFIRYAGLVLFGLIGLALMPIVKWQFSFMMFAFAFISWYYPIYYYKAIGREREEEWNKMYEFIWVIKHNIMLYGPAKTYMNVKMYIEEHAPHNLELIQGFSDFYEYWQEDEIHEYVQKYYPFSIPREITQIIFNMNKTGEFPEEELNSLREFIINTQNLSVEKILSGVTSKATLFSLPFLMVTVILALMIPLVVQIANIF